MGGEISLRVQDKLEEERKSGYCHPLGNADESGDFKNREKPDEGFQHGGEDNGKKSAVRVEPISGIGSIQPTHPLRQLEKKEREKKSAKVNLDQKTNLRNPFVSLNDAIEKRLQPSQDREIAMIPRLFPLGIKFCVLDRGYRPIGFLWLDCFHRFVEEYIEKRQCFLTISFYSY